MNDEKLEDFRKDLEELVELHFGEDSDNDINKIVEFMYIGLVQSSTDMHITVGTVKDQNSIVRKEMLNEAARYF